MSMIDPLSPQSVAQAIGWALVQFVWQGAILGVLTAAFLAMLRRSAPDVRYVVSAIGLALMLTLPVVTAVQAIRGPAHPAAPASRRANVGSSSMPAMMTSSDGTGLATTSAGGGGTPAAELVRRSDAAPLAVASPSTAPWLLMLVVAWLCGVACLSLRLASGWVWAQAMKRRHTRPAPEPWQRTIKELSRRLHIRRPVQLLETAAITVPSVIGWLRPVVLLPASALGGMSPRQLEAILAHELAHIRRHDYLVNLLQTLVETLLFYHPAVWWVSRRIRVEREHCCDDLAVSLCGDPYTYASALADLEELRGSSHRLALAATGGSLLQRVRRLLGSPHPAGRGPGWAAGLAAALLMAGVAAGAIGNELAHADRHLLIGANLRPWHARAARLDINLQDPADAVDLLVDARAATQALVHGARAATRALADGARGVSLALAEGARAVSKGLSRQSRRARREWDVDAVAPIAPIAPAAPVEPVAAMAMPDGVPFVEIPGVMAIPQAPTPPTPPAPPSAPAPPAPASESVSKSRGNFSWSKNGEKLSVNYDGAVEFTDNDADVARLAPGGHLTIAESGSRGARRIEVTAANNGAIQRRFWVGGAEQPFEPEGRRWLAEILPRVIRQSGIGAAARVARFLKAGGPSAVLAEISRIDGSWGKRVYFSELLRTATLDAPSRVQVLTQAGREIDSDFELASLLIEGAPRLLSDDTTRRAYLDAARSIDSDFELHRVLTAALAHAGSNPAVLVGLLAASESIGSDFEEASLLTEVVASSRPLDDAARGAFFKALATVESDFEHHRVLKVLANRPDLGDDVVRAMLESSSSIGSDFEQGAFLSQVASKHLLNASLREPFFRAVANVGSQFERGNVLKTIASQRDLADDVLVSLLQATGDMGGNFEASQVLQTVAAHQRLTGRARDLYIEAARRLGQFEQGQAMTALVNSERR
jgi:beta-lactamase regulating signal transducer with metallopeptidase domain